LFTVRSLASAPQRTSPALTRAVSLSAALIAACASGVMSGCGEPMRELSTPRAPAAPGSAPAPLQGPEVTPLAPAALASPPSPPPPPPPTLTPAELAEARVASVAEEVRVVVVEGGEERALTEEEALRQGYTIVDLRDSWTPRIFQTHSNTEGELLEHPYHGVFVGLANDTGDSEGQPLEEEEYNYLEVFGIPPSMSVLAKRFFRAATEPCYREIDYAKITAAGAIRFGGSAQQKGSKRRLADARAAVEKAMERLVVDHYDDLVAAAPELKDEVALIQKVDAERLAIENIERVLTCDEHNHPRYKHQEGALDEGLRMALRRFQRKHKLYEYANLQSDTLEVLGTPTDELNFQSFRRSLEERVIAATGVLEDGSVERGGEPPSFTGADGERHPVRNLVKEFTDAAMAQMGAGTVEEAKAFFERHPAQHFRWLRVGFKAPPYPEYYSEHMDLDIVVDRGDIWYEPPFDRKGKPVRQPRKRLPKFKLYTTYLGKRFQLIHWPTTIGGWRTEVANNGHDYYKYKNSDVGARVIRNIISGPVWIPPKTTPLKSLTKRLYVNGRAQNVVNYEEMGPGYLSAYGLVAGYFVIPRKDGRDLDRGIRAHGSSDFMSILSPERFSHGCHRLKNDLAVRLYSFMISHRNKLVRGDQPVNHERQFLSNDEVYEIRVLSRGFLFEMTPPVPVEVLEGNILGAVKSPIESYVPVPGHKYPSGDPNDSPVPVELLEGGTEPVRPAE
jgi:hypothetical protein